MWVTGNTETQTRNNILALQERFGENRPEGGLFWVDTPLAYHSNRGLPDYYRELQTILTVPLVLHNDPDCVHTTRTFKRHNIRTAVLKELIQIEGIAGLIFSGSLERAHHYQRACRKRKDFRIYDGDEKRFLEQSKHEPAWSLLGQIWHQAPGKELRNPQFSCMHTGKIIPIACSRYGNRGII